MGLRRSREETIAVSGSAEVWFRNVRRALEAEGFSRIEASLQARTLKAVFWKSRVRGDLEVTFVETDRVTNVVARATAEILNLDALIWNPATVILTALKQAINRCLVADFTRANS